MRWILHRGNDKGPNSVENDPIKVYDLLMEGHEIEIDIWYVDNSVYMGHDNPQHLISEIFLEHPGLWIHCKDAATLEYMNMQKKHLHYFYHTDEDYVLTSKGYIWCYTGNNPLEGSVIVMPEKSNYNWQSLNDKKCIICSDYSKLNYLNKV